MPRITLRVYNYPRLEPSVLAESEAVASAILRQAGVETEWLDCALSMAEYDKYPACHREMGPTDFVLRILTRSMALKMAADHEPLGFAPRCPDSERACPFNIFYHRVDELAGQGDARAERVLGHTIAHELGHLLLGSNVHSPNGIMRGVWSPDDLKRMNWSYFLFTADQSRLLKAAICLRRERLRSSQNMKLSTRLKGMHHFAMSKEENIGQVHGIGPFKVIWVSPEITPTKPDQER